MTTQDSKTYNDKVSQLAADTSGIAERHAHEEATFEVEKSRKASIKSLGLDLEDDEGEFDEAAEEEEDTIVVEPGEDKDDEGKETEEEPVEEEEAEEEPTETDDEIVAKLKRKLKAEKKLSKTLKKKLGDVERQVAWLTPGREEQAPSRRVEEVREQTDEEIYRELGIDDPDDTLSASQTVALNKKLREREEARRQAREHVSESKEQVDAKLAKRDKELREEYEDYEQVVGPNIGLLDPKSPDYDRNLAQFIVSRKDPQLAFYELLKEGRSKSKGSSEMEERKSKALKKRAEKQQTLTINRAPGSGKGAPPKRGPQVPKSSLFDRLMSMSPKEEAAFTEKHGGDPYK